MSKKENYNSQAEALRGIACLCVVIHHLSQDRLDSSMNLARLTGFVMPGHIFVLVFFMLSGYVIGITNTNQRSNFDSITYLKKRLVRIYPIYFIVAIGSFLISKNPVQDLASTLLFAQNILTDNLSANRALWSLNHEFLYYLIFILLVKGNIPVYAALGGTFTLGLACLVFPSLHPLVPAYSIGLFFWLSGLFLAWKLPNNTASSGNEGKFLLSMVLLLVCCHVLNPLYGLIPLVDLNPGFGNQNIVNIYDLVLWPFCFVALLVFSSKKFAYTAMLVRFCQLICFSYILVFLLRHREWNRDMIDMTLVFCGSIVFSFVHLHNRWLTPFEYFGKISYALYVVHMPLMYLLSHWTVSEAGKAEYFVKLGLFLVLSISISHLLERVLQPKIKRLFFP